MNAVTDNELLLFHYGDGLDAARTREVEHALSFDSDLVQRLVALRMTLQAAGDHWPVDDADDGLEARVWTRLHPALPQRAAPLALWQRLSAAVERWRSPSWAFASLLLAAVAVGYLLGRVPAPAAPATPVVADALLTDDASSRVLAAYQHAHLQQAERTLLVASRSPHDGAGAAQLAASLLETNRLYALAAERAGKPALGNFLRELEPVLIELANEPGAITPALSEEIRRRDLTFKTRAAAALVWPSAPAQDLPVQQSL